MKAPEKCAKFVQSQKERPQNNVIDIVLVSLLLNLNRSHILFWCFNCWLWANKCRQGILLFHFWHDFSCKAVLSLYLCFLWRYVVIHYQPYWMCLYNVYMHPRHFCCTFFPFNPFMHNVEKMDKYTSKIPQCSQLKIFKVCMAIFQDNARNS